MYKNVSLIATGDELVKGDYVDTNSHYFAQKCNKNNIDVISHQIVIDKQDYIENAIKSIIDFSDAIIICGGLGPTSDDKTRFAVASFCNTELVFNEKVCNDMKDRLAKLNITFHDANKQQALFPKNSFLIHNTEGIANGFKAIYQDTIIYVLPGPPKECIPMFDNYVIKDLKKHNFPNHRKMLFYKMLGVLEPKIASDIDSFIKGKNLQTAYRWDYPYLDVKVFYEDKCSYDQINTYILNNYAANIVGISDITALSQLNTLLKNNTNLLQSISIIDNLTKGLFFNKIAHKGNINNNNNMVSIVFEGLQEYYKAPKTQGQTSLNCKLMKNNKCIYKNTLLIPYKNEQVINYAVEYIAYQIITIINRRDYE